ncbi:AAA family ATPase [Pseudomonas nitroreducens]|uniref:AAA family ATPase n=1 Tax=Pseudomonas nitroreducens TaxID=46680 RepID=UPI001FB7FB95|nr:ATP-binding protein [Pseudomonas nitroreducens]MCJ1879671.1 ATP-binding protein [Pseudomonas nitroreducens]MCJ1896832.1 ATP-binding protein [Pseudomonas nitroreducens]
MIHSLSFENFFSFAERTEISFLMDGRATPNDKSAISPILQKRVSKVIAVVGANGAGKTNAIKPFAFLAWFIASSLYEDTEKKIQIYPNLFTKNKTSKFSIEFETKRNLYRYTLHISRDGVELEELAEKTSRLWSTVFSRTINADDNTYIVKAKGLGITKKQLEKINSKVSLISATAPLGAEKSIEISEYFDEFSTNIHAFGKYNFTGLSDVLFATSYYEENEEHRQKMISLLRNWDFGLSDIKIEKTKGVDSDGNEKEYSIPFGIHKSSKRTIKLALTTESSGTQAAYYLLSRILPALETGGTIVFDELESDMHPIMLHAILSLFFNEKTNPKNAQIIFTTHSLSILNELQKCQILLVEKNNGMSEAWKLSDMEGVRSDDNFFAKYMSGSYGATPRI